jgi:PilZ domain-containing protein
LRSFVTLSAAKNLSSAKMCRGGLRFKSTSRYTEQTLIEVAVPYSSGQAAIFVAARIVFVQELPEQNLFRYGVQYLSSDKPRGAF